MPSRIFVSYSKQDPQPTRKLVNFLEAQRFTVWWDTALTSGEVFREVIDRELDEADAVVVIWTPQSIRSEWVVSEADHAARQKKLVPARTADVEPWQIPKPFNIRHVDLVDNQKAILAAIRRTIEAGKTADSKIATSVGPAASNPTPRAATRIAKPAQRPREKKRDAPPPAPAPRLSEAQVTGIYNIPGVGEVAVAKVLSGNMAVGAQVQVVRGGRPIHSGAIVSLQIDRVQVATAEVGSSCGLLLAGFSGLRHRDTILLAAAQSYPSIDPDGPNFGAGRIIGRGRIISLFNVPGVGRIAGCRVETGKFVVGRPVRVVKGKSFMQTDAIVSLKIHNDFVLEAGNGAECGVRLLYHDSYAAGWTIECCAS